MWESPSKFPQQLRKVVHRKNSHDSFKIGTHHCYTLSAVCFAYKIPETSDVSVVPVLSELSTWASLQGDVSWPQAHLQHGLVFILTLQLRVVLLRKYFHPDLSMGGATFCLEPLTQLTTDQASPIMADSQVVEKFSFWSVCVLSQASGQKSQEGFFFL